MIPLSLKEWALRHHVGVDAMAELSAILGASGAAVQGSGGSEGRVQSMVRLAAPAHGMRLWRNNVGVLTDERGVPVRYGLANDSPALNKRLKSSDLIGWRRLEIRPEMVGYAVAQFVSIECKREGWKHSPRDAHEAAQLSWLTLVQADGGYARFVTGAEQLGQA
jgi:hypothetical protein